jgi:protein gp37
MSIHTNIGWADSGVNCTSGCDGCGILRTCYARKLHETRLAKALPKLYDADFLNVRLIPGRMAQAAHWSDLTGKDRPDKPWLNGRPRHIFISDMSDALSEAVPFEYLEHEIINQVLSREGKRHIWLWLTKQPKRMVDFAAWLKPAGFWPANLYAGTSVTNQPTADLRIPWLLRVPAPKRFVSYEPALGLVDFQRWIELCHAASDGECSAKSCPQIRDGEPGRSGRHCPLDRWSEVDESEWPPTVDWLIIGGESGPDFRPLPLAWVRSVADQCREAGVKCFVKQAAGLRPGQQDNLPDDLWALKEIP